jgi:hypothetical protein
MDRPSATHKSNRSADDSAATPAQPALHRGGSPAPSPDLLLDLARLADLPFTASWFLLADSKLRERLMKGGWGGAIPAESTSRPQTRNCEPGDRRCVAAAGRL